MNHLFFLKLIAELLDDEKPTSDEIKVAKKILKEMIESPIREMEQVDKESLRIMDIYGHHPLSDKDAEQARKELLG